MDSRLIKVGDFLVAMIRSDEAAIYGLAEGDAVMINKRERHQQAPDDHDYNRAAFADELREALRRMPVTEPVVEWMRLTDRY